MCRHTDPTSIVLAPLTTATAAARDLVRRRACRAHATHLVPTLELIVTELVTNAVRYGQPPITLDVDCRYGSGVHLSVGDAGPLRPRIPAHHPPPRTDAEGGRGMVLVEELSTRWGVTDVAGAGKWVWSVVDPERAVAF